METIFDRLKDINLDEDADLSHIPTFATRGIKNLIFIYSMVKFKGVYFMEEISDLIIRNGKIIDGSGGPEILSDILIKDGKIKNRKISPSINVKKEIDANGFIVTPGFVDIHTIMMDKLLGIILSPSSWHGVTTALMGNCGVGFAPVHDHDHDRL